MACARLRVAVMVAGLVLAGLAPARATGLTEHCHSDNYEMRIRGCTESIERGNLSPFELGTAYARAHSATR